MQSTSPFSKGEGSTRSERYLNALCEKSFLSLWSYANIFRDEGVSQRGEGKEVCDLLVVFDNHILIFSDKDCSFPCTSQPDVAWKRWYKRAILKSAQQVWGAEKWIKEYPDRLYLDRKCSLRFPIALPKPEEAVFHRLVVAHNASSRCKAYFCGGSGSLMIDSTITGHDHLIDRAKGGYPYHVGHIDPSKGFVHVFDDVTLDIVMGTLDTITDFVSYLTKKEALFTHKQCVVAAGEEELLAYYLSHSDKAGEHYFAIPPGVSGVFMDEGHWETFLRSPQRAAQVAADDISYSWDRLIEKFTHHLVTGTQYYSSHVRAIEQRTLLAHGHRRQTRHDRRRHPRPHDDGFEYPDHSSPHAHSRCDARAPSSSS